jgi:hypothetical protein
VKKSIVKKTNRAGAVYAVLGLAPLALLFVLNFFGASNHVGVILAGSSGDGTNGFLGAMWVATYLAVVIVSPVLLLASVIVTVARRMSCTSD